MEQWQTVNRSRMFPQQFLGHGKAAAVCVTQKELHQIKLPGPLQSLGPGLHCRNDFRRLTLIEIF